MSKIPFIYSLLLDYDNFRTHPDNANPIDCPNNCGYYGANRDRADGKGLHYGEDILSTPGYLVLSPVSGKVMQVDWVYNSTATGDFRKLKRVAVDFGYIPDNGMASLGYSVFLYTKSKDYMNFGENSNNRTNVEVGSIIGIAQDIHKYGYNETTVNHVHHQVGFNYTDKEKGIYYTSPNPKEFFDYNQIQIQIDNRYAPLKEAYKSINDLHLKWGV